MKPDDFRLHFQFCLIENSSLLSSYPTPNPRLHCQCSQVIQLFGAVDESNGQIMGCYWVITSQVKSTFAVSTSPHYTTTKETTMGCRILQARLLHPSKVSTIASLLFLSPISTSPPASQPLIKATMGCWDFLARLLCPSPILTFAKQNIVVLYPLQVVPTY